MALGVKEIKPSGHRRVSSVRPNRIALPKEDGFVLIRQVRTFTQERGKTVLAIAVTTYATEKMRQRAGLTYGSPNPCILMSSLLCSPV
jgi:CheY-like chemotaxis protein